MIVMRDCHDQSSCYVHYSIILSGLDEYCFNRIQWHLQIFFLILIMNIDNEHFWIDIHSLCFILNWYSFFIFKKKNLFAVTSQRGPKIYNLCNTWQRSVDFSWSCAIFCVLVYLLRTLNIDVHLPVCFSFHRSTVHYLQCFSLVYVRSLLLHNIMEELMANLKQGKASCQISIISCMFYTVHKCLSFNLFSLFFFFFKFLISSWLYCY
jgi:hypothetical protein